MVDFLEPNHYSRIARLRKYFPKVYEKLVTMDRAIVPPENTIINEYRYEAQYTYIK
jgi:hypothetical protein